MTGLYLGIFAFVLVFATGFRWFQLIYAVAIPKNRIGFLASMLIGVCLGIAALIQGAGTLGGILASLSILLGSLFVFTWSISIQKGSSEHLQPGSKLISFTALDHLDESFDSMTLDGQPILLKFFRGHW